MGGEQASVARLVNGKDAPMAVVPERFAVTRMQTFAQVWLSTPERKFIGGPE
jgi:hypothetical protein